MEFHKRQLIAVFIYRFPLPINKATFYIRLMRFDVYFFFSKCKTSLYFYMNAIRSKAFAMVMETDFFLERNGLLYDGTRQEESAKQDENTYQFLVQGFCFCLLLDNPF